MARCWTRTNVSHGEIVTRREKRECAYPSTLKHDAEKCRRNATCRWLQLPCGLSVCRFRIFLFRTQFYALFHRRNQSDCRPPGHGSSLGDDYTIDANYI
jgi:hypothetical protein